MVKQIMGIDCSARPANVGLARALRQSDGWVLDEVGTGGKGRLPAEVAADWILAGPAPLLLALDAPLGWPLPLARALAAHRAGQPLEPSADHLFRRETDRVVRERIGKRSFDVGADRIARTAHWSLQFLAKVEQHSGMPIPLAWTVQIEGAAAAIEVYPAATLLSHGVAIHGYKKRENRSPRVGIVAKLAEHIGIGRHKSVLLAGGEALDAAVCVLAGMDFLDGRCIVPHDTATAEAEGWIWVREP